MGIIAEHVGFLENKAIAFENLYKQGIENQIKSHGGNISILNLTRYDWASSLENHFYPMRKKNEGIGLILPFRKLIFHNLDYQRIENNTRALIDFSEMNKYRLAYYEFAWQHEPVIEALSERTPFDGILWQVK